MSGIVQKRFTPASAENAYGAQSLGCSDRSLGLTEAIIGGNCDIHRLDARGGNGELR